MSFTIFILIFASLSFVLGLLMKFSKTVQGAFRLNEPGVNKKYMNYKINFLIIIGFVLVIIKTISLINPEFSDKLDILISVFLLLAIAIDTMAKRKIRNKDR